ncbi:OsmC family protein [Lentibacter sp. XHP0401]|uniref:OsmC family protein n=1 Tax=Lentibacter sp. XHP0401 TaxID=2984334 RepID=UPI0021E98A61|nr:OsmC family protein [Lentibacter sp. XHP0401]MCV2891564.1 OsmC family protein [Lentibacter sp. XHP0401]
MSHAHDFDAKVVWTGNLGTGNESDKGYARTWEVRTEGKPVIACSNDPLLGGDPRLHNPEDMLIAAISACHMLWYLHLAYEAGVVVLGYEDDPVGHGESEPSGAGRFVSAELRPRITLAAGTDLARADAVHSEIAKVCFIARSVAFPVRYKARYKIASVAPGA